MNRITLKNMMTKIKISKIIYFSLILYVCMIFLRDALLLIEFLLVNKRIPNHNIQLENASSYIIYLRDFFMILWNFIWSVFLIFKNKRISYLIWFYLFILLSGVLVSGISISGLQFLSDVRIINGIHAALGVFFITKYFFKVNKEFSLNKIVLLMLYLIVLDAIVSIVEFSFIGWNFGFRVMGLFTNSQMNSFVLLMAIPLLYFLKHYNEIKSRTYFILLMLIVFAIVTTGTRTGMMGAFLLLLIFFVKIIITSVNKRDYKVVMFLIALLLIFILIPIILDNVNMLAGRGDVLAQNQAGSEGRMAKLINILNALSLNGYASLLFGEGIGFGSNIMSSMALNMSEAYRNVDGSIQYLLVRAGFVGVLLFIYLAVIIYQTIKNKYFFIILSIPIMLINISINIFEAYTVLLIIGLAISYIYQKELNGVVS